MSQMSVEPGVNGVVCECTMQSPAPPKHEPCKHSGLVVECPNGRSVSIDDTTHDFNASILIVAGPSAKADDVKATTTIIEGPCSSGERTASPHKDKVFDLEAYPNHAVKITTKTDSLLKFKACSIPISSTNALDYLWPTNVERRYYTIYCNTCDARELRVFVGVYPDIHWKADLEFGFGSYSDQQSVASSGASKNGAKTGAKASKTLTDESLSGKLEIGATIDGEEHKLGGQFSKYVKHVLKSVNATRKVVDYVAPRMKSLGGAKLKVEYPKVKLSGDWQWEELPGKTDCGFRYDFSFGFKPLLGLTGEVDLLTALLNSTGPAGATLNYVRDLLKSGEENLTIDIYIKATLSGKIEGELSYAKKSDEEKGSGEGEISLPIACSVEGGGKIDGKILWVKAGAEAKFGAKSSITPSLSAAADTNGPYINGKIEFNGITVYAAYLYGISVDIEKKQTDTSDSAGNHSKSSSAHSDKSGGYENSTETEWQWMAPQTWMDEKTYIVSSRKP